MNLPWVGRTAFKAVVSERDRLRGQNDMLVEQIVGLTRVSNGLRETRREKVPREALPVEVRDLIQGWESKASRDQMETQARLLRKQGMEWTEIETILRNSI